MVEFQIIDITTGFKIRQVQDGITSYESNAYPKGGAKLEIKEERITLYIHKYNNVYHIPIEHLAIPVNNGSISDVFNKLTPILY